MSDKTKEQLEAERAEAIKLCQLHAHPGCNAGAHALARKLLEIYGELK